MVYVCFMVGCAPSYLGFLSCRNTIVEAATAPVAKCLARKRWSVIDCFRQDDCGNISVRFEVPNKAIHVSIRCCEARSALTLFVSALELRVCDSPGGCSYERKRCASIRSREPARQTRQ